MELQEELRYETWLKDLVRLIEANPIVDRVQWFSDLSFMVVTKKASVAEVDYYQKKYNGELPF